MKKEELEKYEKLLLKKREELLRAIQDKRSQTNKTTREATGDLSSYSYHMADQGTDAIEREKAFMIASKSGRLIYHIDQALMRIRKGEFGICHSCGKPIQKARLTAVPHARLCIECKEKEEQEKTSRK